jgi:hypothetical protein
MDIAAPLDELRIAVAEAEVLATLTRAAYDSADWREPDPDIVERIAILLGVVERSTVAALAAFHRLHGAVADAQPAPAGEAEAFDYSDGTAPGDADAMSEPDAVIVQRIRMRCPDNRYEGSSDVELLQLFKRNRKVLARGDEDVIAAMTRPR